MMSLINKSMCLHSKNEHLGQSPIIDVIKIHMENKKRGIGIRVQSPIERRLDDRPFVWDVQGRSKITVPEEPVKEPLMTGRGFLLDMKTGEMELVYPKAKKCIFKSLINIFKK